MIVTTFANNEDAQRRLNEGDRSWDIPPGTYDRLLASLANAALVSELHATERFDRLKQADDYGRDVLWRDLIEAANRARPSIERAAQSVGDQKMQLAMRELRSHAGDSGYVAQSLVATWIGDYRFKTRPDHRGLISTQQLSELRAVLQPGDVLLERRNWFMSNAFLPGFWPHAAVYLGDPAALRQLGLTGGIPAVVRHLPAFLAPDAAGDPHVIIEAISEGVVFTSLEHSIGQADAVAVLRPRLTAAERREAISRAFSHYGKPYDFEFDFFSTDRLVCTELVYRAYDGMIDLPLSLVLGRQAIPAMTFVQVYSDTRGREDRPFDLVYVLDVDEDGGRAVTVSEAVFLQTLDRAGLTFLQ